MSTLKSKAQSILNEKTSKVIPGNIKDGVTIFGVTGVLDAQGIDTSDATATQDDVVFGKTAYAQNNKLDSWSHSMYILILEKLLKKGIIY